MTTQPVNLRLSWARLKDLFEGQWVELIDFDWDWSRAHPTWARVRHFASDRKELLKKIGASPEIEDTIVVYVGALDSVVQQDPSAATL